MVEDVDDVDVVKHDVKQDAAEVIEIVSDSKV